MNFTDLAELKWTDINLSDFSYVRNKTGIKLNVKIPDNNYMKTMLNYFEIYRPFDTDCILPILEKEEKLYTKEELRDRKKSVLNYLWKTTQYYCTSMWYQKQSNLLYCQAHFRNPIFKKRHQYSQINKP